MKTQNMNKWQKHITQLWNIKLIKIANIRKCIQSVDSILIQNILKVYTK